MAIQTMLRRSRRLSRFKFLHLQTKVFPTLFFSSYLDGSSYAARSDPPPITVLLTESAGRGVFATRRIGAGDLIHTAKPLLAHPTLSAIHSVCYFCLRKLGNSSYFKVPSASFCSEKCFELSKAFFNVETSTDWSAFDDYCKNQGLKYPLLVKRLACMVISGAISMNLLDILQHASLSSHMISEMEEEFNLLSTAFTKANIPDEQLKFLTKQWYTGNLARIRINAFRIELAGGLYEDLLSSAAALVEADAGVGHAVYMLPSMYNHDCDPNAHIIWIESADARLKALRDIEAARAIQLIKLVNSVVKHKIAGEKVEEDDKTSRKSLCSAKSFGSAISMQVWIIMLDKLYSLEDLVLGANALDVCRVIK